MLYPVFVSCFPVPLNELTLRLVAKGLLGFIPALCTQIFAVFVPMLHVVRPCPVFSALIPVLVPIGYS